MSTPAEGTLAAAQALSPRPAPGFAELDLKSLRGVTVKNADHLAALLAEATTTTTRVLPLGGGRGGPARHSGFDVALDLTGMSRVLAHDPESWLVHAEAGITLGALQQHVEGCGGSLATWRREHPACTVGGLLSASQPAPHALWNGSVREACIGLSAVTGRGDAYAYIPAPRKAAGPDLRYLLIGGDGAFGVITAAWLGVAPAAESRRALTLACPAHADALAFVRRAFTRGLRCPNMLYSGRSHTLQLLFEGRDEFVALMDSIAREAARDLDLRARALDPDTYYQPAAGDVRAGADPTTGRPEDPRRAAALWGSLSDLHTLPARLWDHGVLYDLCAHHAALLIPQDDLDDATRDALDGRRAAWIHEGAPATLDDAPRRAAAQALAAIKRALDPAGILGALPEAAEAA